MQTLSSKHTHLLQAVVSWSKTTICLVFSSLLLISSSSLAEADERNSVAVADNIDISVVIPSPVKAGAKENSYFYQVTNNSPEDFRRLTLEHLLRNVKWLMPTPQEVAQINQKAIACQFNFLDNGLKINQSCIVKFNFDASDLAKGNVIKMKKTAIVGEAKVDKNASNFYKNYFPVDVTVDPIPGILSFQAEGLGGNNWMVSDDGKKYVLTVTNASEDSSSEIDAVAIDLDMWNGSNLDKFRAYFGNELPTASPGCAFIAAEKSGIKKPCTFTFEASKDAVGHQTAPLFAALKFTSNNVAEKVLTVSVINHGTLDFAEERDAMGNWHLDDDGGDYVLTVINTVAPAANTENSAITDITIDPIAWASDDLKDLRAYFGEKVPVASKGCRSVKPGSTACTFIFTRRGQILADNTTLNASVVFRSSNTLSKSLQIAVSQTLLNFAVDNNDPKPEDATASPGYWVISDSEALTSSHTLNIFNISKQIVDNVEITQASWDRTSADFKAYFNNQKPASDSCTSIVVGGSCTMAFTHTASEKLPVKLIETLHFSSSIGTKFLTVVVNNGDSSRLG